MLQRQAFYMTGGWKEMKDKETVFKEIAVITVAAFIYGVGISLFLDPNNLAPGGATGIAIMINHYLPIGTGTWYLLINIPIVLLGIYHFGWKFIARTAYAVFIVSVFTNLLAQYPPLTDDLMMAALAGGALSAVGMGIILRCGATTGGTDIIVKIIRQRLRHLKTGFLFLCSDFIIVCISGLVFKNLNTVLYAVLTVIITGKTLDCILYGSDEARLIYIITENPAETGQRLLHDLDVGYTYLDGKGGWTERKKKVILCAVQKKVSPLVEEIVKAEDPKAFMIVTSANEVFGEGYKDFFSEVL